MKKLAVPDKKSCVACGLYHHPGKELSQMKKIIGLVTNTLFKPRTWCSFCPMGTMTQMICKIKAGEKL